MHFVLQLSEGIGLKILIVYSNCSVFLIDDLAFPLSSIEPDEYGEYFFTREDPAS